MRERRPQPAELLDRVDYGWWVWVAAAVLLLAIFTGRGPIRPTTVSLWAMFLAMAVHGLGYRAALRDRRALRPVRAMYPSEWLGLALYCAAAGVSFRLDGLFWLYRLQMTLLPIACGAAAWRRQLLAKKRALAPLVRVFE